MSCAGAGARCAATRRTATTSGSSTRSGFDLPVGRLTRTPHGEYPEYHTSADDLSFVTDVELAESLPRYSRSSTSSSTTRRYVNLSPYGEPQLGTRGLYPTRVGRAPPMR